MVEVSNPDRVLFPASGLTKADVVDHYERVGPAMVQILAGRPLTLQRFPRGIEAKGFLQKNAPDHFPPTIRRHRVAKRSGGETNYAVVDRPEDLVYLANQGTITFHMWTAAVGRLDAPDWLVLDLDPEAGDIDGVRHAAWVLHAILDEFGLSADLVATGSKGFHLWVALGPGHTYGQVSVASRALAGIAAQRSPDGLTTEFLKRDRTGRVFVDWLRNTPIATTVVPFSLRPRASAPVAVPIDWDELDDVLPDAVTLADLQDGARVATRAGLFRSIRHDLPLDAILDRARSAGVDLETPHDRFGRR